MSPVQLASHVVRLAATTIRQRLVALKPPYGIDARQALQADLPIGTEVGLRLKATDRYVRTVAEVLKGATNINQALVQQVLPLFIGSTSKTVIVKPIHALKMKHV